MDFDEQIVTQRTLVVGGFYALLEASPIAYGWEITGKRWGRKNTETIITVRTQWLGTGMAHAEQRMREEPWTTTRASSR